MPVPLDRVEGFGDGLRVVHGFTCREGGRVKGPWGSLPLARAEGLADAEVEASWARVLGALGVDRLALVSQVHGAEVVRAHRASGPLAVLGTADAIVSTEPGLAIAVRVADCVPILLAAPGGVAAVHAGWRGVVGGVLARAVEALCEATGASPAQVQAAVGPHIGQAAFEVGPEVVEALVGAGFVASRVARPGRDDRSHVDLGAAVHDQLRGLGVVGIGAVGRCTTEGPYYSWRAQGPSTGRQAGVIAWLG